MVDRPRFLHDIVASAKAGQLTAEHATASALERISAWNAKLKAFVALQPERALAEARHLDELAAMGVPKGPLFGAPLAVKDLIDVAGLPTRAGSLTRHTVEPATRDAAVITLLRRAGAIIIGKTATVEYAFGGWGTNETQGTPLNPWDLETPRVPGGSSNGSGVAVAAGLVPGALGSDTGGSIRLPASFSGLVGLKTTAGLIDKSGVLPLCDQLDTLGVMTRCVEDAAMMFQAIVGKPCAASNSPINPTDSLRDKRIGLLTDLGADLQADTQRVFVETQRLLRDAGANLFSISLRQSLAEYTASCGMFLAVEGYLRYGKFAEERPCRLGKSVQERILSGKSPTASHFLANLWQREREKAHVAEVFDRVDALLMPSTAMPAPTVAEHREEESPAVFTRFANYFDLAALSLPMGLSQAGLPIGLQIVVPGGREARALMLARGLEAARGGPILCPILDR